MFFIGPSSHIFVYLLVSAFCLICFYAKGETISRELPVREVSYATFSFPDREVPRQVKQHPLSMTRPKTELHLPPLPEKTRAFPVIPDYQSPYLSNPGGRAPPVR